MNFYTYIGLGPNKVYVRDMKNGTEYSGYEDFCPTLFLPSPKDKSNYKNLNSEPLASHTFGGIKDCKEFLAEYDDISNYPIYGNRNFIIQYISNTYSNKIKWDKSLIRIFTLDIEVSAEDGFPDVRLAESPITAITIHNSIDNVYYAWGTGEFKSKDKEKQVQYFRCESEHDLLRHFVNWWSLNPPHIITGWNCKLFDVPYIINRVRSVTSEENRLSPINYIYEKNIQIAGRMHQVYSVTGISVLDYMELYKKFTYKVRESYRLDYIGQVELGLQKLEVEDIQGYDLYKTDYQKFIEYNIRDVEIVEKLDEKMKLLDLAMTMAYESKINFEDVFSPVKTWESIIYNFLKEQRIAIPDKRGSGGSGEAIVGGYVKNPHIGLHKWVVSFDLNSLYPHLIQQYNISPETLHTGIICADSENIGVEGLLEQKLDTDYLKVKDLTVTPNGQHFTRKFKGFLPKLMETIYNERVEFKKKMLKEEQRLEDGIYTNKQTIVNNIAKYNNIQMSKKILLNSAYGALANQYFLYHSPEQAEAVTTSGQLSIRWIENSINKYINNLLSTEKIDYVIAADTDSIYVTFDRLVSKVFKDTTQTDSTSKIITFLDKISKDKIEPFINSSYEALHSYVNSYAQKMHMGREVIADKGIWTAKKRYILNVYDSEGVRFKEPKLKIMGLESVRSSTPQWCRENIHALIKTIINTDEKTVIKSIDVYREKFKQLSFNDIAFPRSVRGLEKYKSTKSIYSKGTPIHVRGVLLYNHFLEQYNLTKRYQLIRDGEKIRFAYLKEPNMIGENVIAVSTVLPKEFKLEKYIDYDLQFDKSFLQPIKNILDTIGWRAENIGTLDSFF
jgi:DNA polymerase elongation subunit (family B)